MSERLLIPPALPQSGLHKNLALRWLALATVLVACEGVAAGPLGDPLPGAQLDRPARSAPVRIADADREKLWGGRRRSWQLHRPIRTDGGFPWPKSMISAET
jgi:hypothetical protein